MTMDTDTEKKSAKYNGKSTEKTQEDEPDKFEAPKRACRRGASKRSQNLITQNSFQELDNQEKTAMDYKQQKQEVSNPNDI